MQPKQFENIEALRLLEDEIQPSPTNWNRDPSATDPTVSQKFSKSRNLFYLALLVISLLLNTLLHLYLINPSGNGAAAYSLTDLEPARAAIETVLIKFKSGLRFDDNGTLYRTFDPKEPRYVGTPDPALDRAWSDITWTQDLFLTQEEAEQVGHDIHLVKEYNLYEANLEMFHGLHCLNMIRKTLYLEFYPKEKRPDLMMHVDHCIDALREAIMCNGDMTPIPDVWSESRKKLIPDFEQVHTCRNFTKLQEWASQRSANILAEENAARLRGNAVPSA